MFATRLISWSYQRLAKPYFFHCDPEKVHDAVCRFGGFLGRFASLRKITRVLLAYEDVMLEQKIFGITFPNPVGLTAGFDKDAELTDIIPEVGFGFAEVGSITGEPCEGNPRPRLWRLPESKGLVVWYGLKNKGCVEVANHLIDKSFRIPIGTNIARTNSPSTVELGSGIEDYAKAFKVFTEIGAYTTVNISCPNTCGGEPFTSPQNLDRLLDRLDAITTTKPIVLKLPVDITESELDDIIDVATRHRVHGFIISNLTKQFKRHEIAQEEVKEGMKGGISGRPVFERSNELISHLYRRIGSSHIIIGSGGIFSAKDAYEKICRGASLVQLATGMIFEGPQLIGEINFGLIDLLKADGFTNVAQAIGSKTDS